MNIDVIKSGGKVIGANLTNAQKKAMDIELRKAMAECDRENTMAIDAIVLWELHDQLGFGAKRLRDFYDRLGPNLDELIRHYELGEGDQAWICIHKLKEIGVDLEAWEAENKE